jgi:hypothetical protein
MNGRVGTKAQQLTVYHLHRLPGETLPNYG